MRRKLIGIYRRQKGITGLETAIILIAFVVVASVFAYTVLSAGLFSTEKSTEAVHSGLEESQSTLQLKGTVTAFADDRTDVGTSDYRNIDVDDDAVDDTTDVLAISKVEFMVACATNGESVDLTPNFLASTFTELTGGTEEVPSVLANDSVTQITYTDANIMIQDCAWSVEWVGDNSGDYILDEGEKAIITVYFVWRDSDHDDWEIGVDSTDPFMDDATKLVETNHQFMLEIKPAHGAVLPIERTTPGYLDSTNDLN